MLLPTLLNPLDSMLKEIHMYELLTMNDSTNLKLTEQDAKEIIETRSYLLSSYDRLELDIDTIKKLITSFHDSYYINQEDYVAIINDLQEVFYDTKNETEDSISDDELIDLLKYYFNNSCQGSIELLHGREMEIYARNCRRNNQIKDYYLKGDE